MPTRDQVDALLDSGHSYETAARLLRIPAGQAFMVATGLPADGSDARHRRRTAGRAGAPGQFPAPRQPSRAQSHAERVRSSHGFTSGRRTTLGRPVESSRPAVTARLAVLRQLRGPDHLGRGAAVKSRGSGKLRARTHTADRVVKSVCPYCAVGCAQNVFVTDERVIQIEGDPDAPHSRGRLCPKGSATLQLTTGSSREEHVLYRPPHGTDWQRLDLDTALAMVADRIVATRREGWEWEHDDARVRRCMSIAALGGATLDNEENYLIKKLLTALGIIQIENQARVCHSSTVVGLGHLVRPGRLQHASRRSAELRPDRARGLEHGRGPPGGLPMGGRGQGARRHGHPRRPALQPHECPGRHVRAAARRDRHRVPRRDHQPRPADRVGLPRVRPRLHQRADDHPGGVRGRRRRRPVLRL